MGTREGHIPLSGYIEFTTEKAQLLCSYGRINKTEHFTNIGRVLIGR